MDRLKREEVVLRSNLALTRPPLPCSPPPSYTPSVQKLRFIQDKEFTDNIYANISLLNSTNNNEMKKSISLDLSFVPTTPMIEKTGKNHFNDIPNEVLQIIFNQLELKERCKVSMVCRRFYIFLTSGYYPLQNVVVLNIFEKDIWEKTVSKNAGVKVQCVKLNSLELLKSVFMHCNQPSSVKLWYSKRNFAKSVYDCIKESKVKLRCLDVYPYSSDLGLSYIYDYIPNLTGMTMRPHGPQFFWSGLDVETFPNFAKMETLLLDSFNVGPNTELPPNLHTFEWLNRGEGRFNEILPKIKKLSKLEYLMLGHAEILTNNEFINFISTISSDNLPSLQYIIFRFCKIGKTTEGTSRFDYLFPPNEVPQQLESNKLEELVLPSNLQLKSLKVLKLDLCYGNLTVIIDKFLSLTGPNLKILSLNVISDDSSIEDMYEISRRLNDRNVALHLGLLQKDKRKKNQPIPEYKIPPYAMTNVLSKFEASFVDDDALIQVLINSHSYSKLTDLKFVQCPSITNDILLHIANYCTKVKKISIINCDDVTEAGILHFVKTFNDRKSRNLQIVWKRDRKYARPASFYLQLVSDHQHLLKGLKARFFSKRFCEENDGERIVIWNNDKKTLNIQDYNEGDQHRVLGIVMTLPTNSSGSSTPTQLVPINIENI
uniref:F-box domain-containing protein n=1 Tax=Parastrongyloides trichosuri TaxID=131310 RepID=A0A0N4ZS89_PARTI